MNLAHADNYGVSTEVLGICLKFVYLATTEHIQRLSRYFEITVHCWPLHGQDDSTGSHQWE